MLLKKLLIITSLFFSFLICQNSFAASLPASNVNETNSINAPMDTTASAVYMRNNDTSTPEFTYKNGPISYVYYDKNHKVSLTEFFQSKKDGKGFHVNVKFLDAKGGLDAKGPEDWKNHVQFLITKGDYDENKNVLTLYVEKAPS